MTADERYTFDQARARLEDIVTQVRKKDTSLERSLDLLEEGVRLANLCTELSDATRWREIAEGDEPADVLEEDALTTSEAESMDTDADAEVAAADPEASEGPSADEVAEEAEEAAVEVVDDVSTDAESTTADGDGSDETE